MTDQLLFRGGRLPSLVILAALVLWSGSAGLAQPPQGQPGGRLLFDAIATPGDGLLAARADRLTRRGRLVRAIPDVLTQADTPAGADLVTLNLFDDVQLRARQSMPLEPTLSGGVIWQGRLLDRPGLAVIAIQGDVIAGSVFAGDQVFEIAYAGAGLHEVREIDQSAYPTDDPQLSLPIVDPNGEAGASDAAVAAGLAPDAAGQVDVLVVWTPAARAAAGGTSAMQSSVNLAVATTNAAYGNSGVTQRIRLVYSGELSYVESSYSTDLSRLATTADGYLDAVHALRDQYGADVVTLIGVGYVNQGICGVGYLMTVPSTSFAPWAFNVVDRVCGGSNLTYAHELGHNMGLHHDPANAGGQQGAYPYAYGYQHPGGLFRTVMAYACPSGPCTRIVHFSNPGVLYTGLPTGTASQNNALALNNTAPSVANFRQAVNGGCLYSLGSTGTSMGSAGGSGTVSVLATSGCAWTANSNAGWITVTSGASGSGNGSVGYSVAPNTVGTMRIGTITIAGRTFTVSQAGIPCDPFILTPTSQSMPVGGGSVTVTVTGTTGCSRTATSNAGWISVTSGASGSGSGSVTLAVAANPGIAVRTGTATIGGKVFSVTQAGVTCNYILSSTSHVLPRAGGSASLSVTTPSTQCPWMVAKDVPWIAISGSSSRTGSGTLTFSAASNTAMTARIGHLTIAGQQVAVTQLGKPRTQALDFNLDAAGDALLVDPTSGAWQQHTRTAAGFTATGGGTWDGGWTAWPGDFNGDDRSDLLLYNPATGAARRMVTQVDGSFLPLEYSWAPGFAVTILDLDADRRSDVFLYNKTTGQWAICQTQAASNACGWRQGLWASGWDVKRAVFNTDGRDDLFLFNDTPTSPNAGLWFRVLTGPNLAFSYIAGNLRWAPYWRVTPADFSGDGVSEVFLYNAAAGNWFVVAFTAGGATYVPGTWAPGLSVHRVEVNRDLKADLFLYDPVGGQFRLAIGQGNGTFSVTGGTWAGGWQLGITDFNLDDGSDLLLYHPVLGSWAQVVTVSATSLSYRYGAFGPGWTLLGGHVVLP